MGVAPLSPQVPLEMLAGGEEGTIVDLHGRPEVVARLQEMGLRLGCRVRMVRPGEPAIVAVDNHRLGFRPEADAMVIVETP